MGFALNILALLLVLGLCWFAMVFLTGRFHGHSPDVGFEPEDHAQRDLGLDVVGMPASGDTCAACEGVGATQERGKLAPCPVCEGTGVYG